MGEKESGGLATVVSESVPQQHGVVTQVRELIAELRDYPQNVIWNEVSQREFEGHKVSGMSEDYNYITFKTQEREFNRNMYDEICRLAKGLNLDLAVEETQTMLLDDITIHLKQGRRTVASLKDDRVTVDSTHSNAEHYFENILRLYSESGEEERMGAMGLREIGSYVKELEASYPNGVIKKEVYSRIKEFRAHWITRIGKFGDINNFNTWAILLKMPEIPFNRENYNNIRSMAEEAGLEFEPGKAGEKVYLKEDKITTAMLKNDGLALNLEHPKVDEYFTMFSKIYTPTS